jgi:hypothetical protein
LYGKAYLFSRRIRIIREFGPVYGISQRKRSVPAESNTGTETLEMTDAMIAASLSVQFQLWK